MPSPFADALHEFVQASTAYAGYIGSMADGLNPERAERRLAQAGDVLEAELRKMMRSELERVVIAASVPGSVHAPFPGEP